MYARVATFESDPSKVNDAIELVRSQVESGDTPEGLEGAKMLMLVNRESGKALRVWPLAGGEKVFELHGHANHPITFASSPDGRSIVSADAKGELILWDLHERKRVKRLSPASA